MVQIGLLMIKIIGWILLGIFGLLAGILLLVLLVPVRYRFTISRHETFRGTVQVTWLLHMFSAVISYEDDFLVNIRVLGRRMFREKEDRHDTADAVEHGVEETLGRTRQVMEDPEDRKSRTDLENLERENPKKERSEKGSPDFEADGTSARKQDKKQMSSGKQRKTTSRSERLKQKILAIQKQWGDIRSFFQNEANQATWKLIWRQIRKILHHIRPVKIRGAVMFGFDDPYTTGQILAAVSMGYGWYGKCVQITPCFEEEILEGELWGKGRICSGVLLYQGIRILLDRNFRKLLKQWRGKGGIQYG